jgi:hypothetical protein
MTQTIETPSTSWMGHVTALAAVGALTMARTVVGMAGLGVVLGVVCGFLGGNGSMVRGIVLGVLALAVCIAVGVPLGAHRATTLTVLELIQRCRIAGTIISAVFNRLLGIGDADPHGQRGTQAVQRIEGMSIAQAEAELDRAIAGTLKVPANGGGARGWIMRRIHARLIKELRRLTLYECRQSLAPDGKVDLVRVREALVIHADELIASHLVGTSARLTRLIVAALCVLLPLAAYLLRQVPLGI